MVVRVGVLVVEVVEARRTFDDGALDTFLLVRQRDMVDGRWEVANGVTIIRRAFWAVGPGRNVVEVHVFRVRCDRLETDPLAKPVLEGECLHAQAATAVVVRPHRTALLLLVLAVVGKVAHHLEHRLRDWVRGFGGREAPTQTGMRHSSVEGGGG